MKNIHLLPTDKTSRLFLNKVNNKLLIDNDCTLKEVLPSGVYQHIYITSDEEIKEGDKIINPTNEVQTCIDLEKGIGTDNICWIKVKETTTLQQILNSEKIILTTDQDLIADGVQSIDDTFLEWFVKNPSCENVDQRLVWDEEKLTSLYKIIIPQEEPKQERERGITITHVGKPKQEIWKDIPNYEGLYQVSNFGNVKSLERYVKGKIENRLQKENILSKRLVGDKGNQYYAVTLCNNKDRKQFKISVLVAMAFLNHIPNGYVGFTVDHIDNNPLNNNVNNLQVITKRENSSKDRKGISKYTGVTFNKKSNKWRSQIWIDGKNKTLGSFDDELEAHRAYQKELQQHLKS
jgi:hypothetical protein